MVRTEAASCTRAFSILLHSVRSTKIVRWATLSKGSLVPFLVGLSVECRMPSA